MDTIKYSFIDIFNKTFFIEHEEIKINKIIIPMIQRDYAQGRKGNNEICNIRNEFINALYEAVVNEPITLDFIYGDIDSQGNLVPLDGQQRLTTLFLLHWYAAKKNNISKDDYDFLYKFSYEIRYSSRDFCLKLVDYNPNFEDTLSQEIENQSWFPLSWKKDPTIQSMLVMIDTIDIKFNKIINLWDRLKSGCITFYFLPIKNMGLTDDLYIKMNSRGKPLTLFEHFKAELEHNLNIIDEHTAARIMKKIDCEWTDLLWESEDKKDSHFELDRIDKDFLNYFKFICDIIGYRDNKSDKSDVFILLNTYFSPNCPNVIENIQIMENMFDCWCNLKKYTSLINFLNSFISNGQHEVNKILVDKNINIFLDCLHSDDTNFPLNRVLLLYAITVYLQNYKNVTEKNFKRRIRIINNLIQNSSDEISNRRNNNRMSNILEQIDWIMKHGYINEDINNNFNKNQLEEEIQKNNFIEQFPHLSETIFELEDHELLYGQIGIIDFKSENLSDYVCKFQSLFKCDLDKVSYALMTVGNYGQKEKNNRLYQYGAKTIKLSWKRLFHKNSNSGFGNTKDILKKLLDKYDDFSNEVLQKIIDNYLENCVNNNFYPFEYYYIKYRLCKHGDSYGKLYQHDNNTKYMYSVMLTERKISISSYVPYLKESFEEYLSKKDNGQKLIINNAYIVCTDDSYLVKDNKNNSILDTIHIHQNKNGIDIEDRIQLLKNYIKNNINNL